MIKQLQALMKQNNINYYLIDSDDDHQSEDLGDYFQVIKYLTGFTGTDSTLLVTVNQAYLWVDGRFFIQAPKEIYDDITLMKINMEGYPSLLELISSTIKENETIGFDGRVMAFNAIDNLRESITIPFKIQSIDLITPIWPNRPAMSNEKAFLFDLKYSGKETKDKLKEVREKMKEKNCTHHLLTTLDDICWLFNIRGNDIDCTPVVLSFALISLNKTYLYLQKGCYDSQLVGKLKTQGVEIRDYDDVYKDIKHINEPLLLDKNKVSYDLYSSLKCPIVDDDNPSTYLKAIKNKTEIKNTINAHIKDGVAMTKFMIWLKENIGHIEMDELSVAKYLEDLRKQQSLYLEPSFTTICAYGKNAALMHYTATEDDYSRIEKKGFLLVDSGGQYLDGTTDVTRTYVLGQITPIEKRDYTLVLKGMLDLQSARFLYGQTGVDLDVLARNPLWKEHIDYQCGTGHGIGHVLCCHENPNEFRPKTRMRQAVALEEGMITSNEPGVYKENEYGIRIENELLCRKDIKNEYGQFMAFDALTYTPIDLDAIDKSLLSYDEIQALNDYHLMVYKTISPYLNEKEKQQLKYYTRKI